MGYQTIKDSEGQAAFVVVPADEWEDILAGVEAKKAKDAVTAGEDEMLPQSVADALMDGENPVKVYRKHRKLSQEALAAVAGITQAAVSSIEAGKRDGSTDTIKALAKALGVTMEDLA